MAYDDFRRKVKAHIFSNVGPIEGEKIFSLIDEETFHGYHSSDYWDDAEEVADDIVRAYNKNNPETIERQRKEQEENKKRNQLSEDVLKKLEKIKVKFPDIAIMDSDFADDVRFIVDCLLNNKSSTFLNLNPIERDKNSFLKKIVVANIIISILIFLFILIK